MMVTHTIGPIATITLLSAITEYKVHVSLRARKMYAIYYSDSECAIYQRLFESQHRRRSQVLVEVIYPFNWRNYKQH